MTKFDTSSLEPGESNVSSGDIDRKNYKFWWQHALRDIRQHSIISWAQRVENAYAQLVPGAGTAEARIAIYKQAILAALHGDGRWIGEWSTEKAIEMSRKSDEECAGLMRVIDQTAAAARLR